MCQPVQDLNMLMIMIINPELMATSKPPQTKPNEGINNMCPLPTVHLLEGSLQP